jgi:bifunctional oligoribonuclease and PAP phosphatase NrnA
VLRGVLPRRRRVLLFRIASNPPINQIMKIDAQTLRNLTTGIIHTKLCHVYESLEEITGEPSLVDHVLEGKNPADIDLVLEANFDAMIFAVTAWLRKHVTDERFWDGKNDPHHSGEIDLPEPSAEDRALMFARFRGMAPHEAGYATRHISFRRIAELMRASKSVVVLSHVNPDGDAIGSTAALYLALRKLGKQVLALNEDGVPETLRFLPGSDQIKRPDEVVGPIEADLVIAVDCATKERLGAKCLALVANAPTLLNIDHHASNEGYGDFHHIWNSPATGEILFDLLDIERLPLDGDIASCLYAAISTDTGSFQFDSVTAHTHEIVARTIRMRVDTAAINRRIYGSQPMRRLRLLRGLLNTLEVSRDGRVASWTLRQSLAKEVGTLPEDSVGLISNILGVASVAVAVQFEETPDGQTRVSLRSKSVDVSAIAARFGGGGHKLAAGIRMPGPLDADKARLLLAVSEAL